jgi:hypothetical protein
VSLAPLGAHNPYKGVIYMSNSSNELTLALLATLEAQAKKSGKKSLVKRVAGQLRKTGAGADLIAQVDALVDSKAPAAARKNGHKPATKAKTKAADGAIATA